MMTKVTVDQVVEFFLYAKEVHPSPNPNPIPSPDPKPNPAPTQVHSLVANARSKQSGRLCNVIFANDITGTRKAPDALFSKALTASSH